MGPFTINKKQEDALETALDQNIIQEQLPSPRFDARGDHERLTDLFRSQRQRLFYTALRLLGNAEEAEDAVQEGLLSAIRNLHRFAGRARLSTWLTRIVVNAALMRLRSLRAHELVPIDRPMVEEGLRFSELLVDERPNPEEVCVRAEQRRILSRAFKGLSRPQRQALSLHDFQGMTSKEAAQILGLSEGTVKSQVHRARRQLSQQIRGIHRSRVSADLARA